MKRLAMAVICLLAVMWIATARPTVGINQVETNVSEREKALSKDFSIAKNALEKNKTDRNAKLIRLSLKHRSLLIRNDAVDALNYLDDKASIPDLIVALDENRGLSGGGTEAELLQEQLNNTIVSALESLTGLKLQTKPPLTDADIKQIIRRSNRWWAAYQRR